LNNVLCRSSLILLIIEFPFIADVKDDSAWITVATTGLAKSATVEAKDDAAPSIVEANPPTGDEDPPSDPRLFTGPVADVIGEVRPAPDAVLSRLLAVFEAPDKPERGEPVPAMFPRPDSTFPVVPARFPKLFVAEEIGRSPGVNP
jgi:hypothetical protein